MYEEIDAILAEMMVLGSGSHKIANLEQHLVEIRRHPSLTRAQATELAQKIESGRRAAHRLEAGGVSTDERGTLEADVAAGAEARPALIGSNLRLVVTVAKSYEDRGLSRVDLIEAGNLGLLAAVEKFQSEKGFTFPVLATWWIRHAMARALSR